MSVLDDFTPDQNASAVLDSQAPTDTSALDLYVPQADTSVLDTPTEQLSVLDAFTPETADSSPAPVYNEDVTDEISQQAADVGVLGRVKNAAFTVIEPVVDILSRTNYATAGFAEALMDDDPQTNPFARAGREMFAGIGGLKGDKHEWGQALEQMGVGEGWKMSELMPWMYNDDGEGIFQFQEDGLMDWTARGAAGLGANIVTDPLTFVDWAGKGVQVAIRGGGKVSKTDQILKAGITVAKRRMTKAGEEALVENLGKGLGLTSNGLETFRRELYTSLPNLDGNFRLRHADPHVQNAYISAWTAAEPIGRTGKLNKMNLRNVKMADMAPKELTAVTKAAQEVAEQRLSNIVLSDPAAAKKLFDDGGIRFMGRLIPGTPKAAEVLSQWSVDRRVAANKFWEGAADKSTGMKWLLESSREVAGRLNGAKRLFKRDLSANPIYNIGKQKIIDNMAELRAKWGGELHRQIGDIHLGPEDWEHVIKALDLERRSLGFDFADAGFVNNYLFGKDLEQYLDQVPQSTTTGKSIKGKTVRQIREDLYTGVVKRATAAGVKDADSVNRAVRHIMPLFDEMDKLEMQLMETDLIGVFGVVEPSTFEKAFYDPGTPDSLVMKIHNAPPTVRAKILEDPLEFVETHVEEFNKTHDLKLDITQKEALQNVLYQRVVHDYVSNVPIYFNNRASKIAQGVSLINETRGVKTLEDLFHGGKQGFYSTMSRSEFETLSKKLQMADPKSVKLDPISDLRELGRARIDQYAQALEAQRFAYLLRVSHGIDVNKGAGVVAKHVFRDLDMGEKLDTTRKQQLDLEFDKWFKGKDRAEMDAAFPAKERGETRDHLNQKAKPVVDRNELPPQVKHAFTAMSRDEKHYWIAKEYLNASTDKELRNIMLRYTDEIADDPSILPKFRNNQTRRELETTNFRELSIRGPVTTEKIWVPVDIFDDFTSMHAEALKSRDVVGVLKAYDGLNSFFKTWVTAPFPSFHLRNLYGNVALGFTDVGFAALDPRDHFLASAIIADATIMGRKITGKAMQKYAPTIAAGALPGALIGGVAGVGDGEGFLQGAAKGAVIGGLGGAALAKARMNYFKNGKHAEAFEKIMATRVQSKTGRTYTIQEITDLGRQLGVYTDDIKLFELAQEYNPYAVGKLTEKYKNFETGLRAPGEVIENEMRMLLFIKHLRRGLDPEDAAARVKKFLFDYSNISPAEKAFFRRVVPFWTFFSKNIPLQVETLLKNPGRISNQIKILQERVNENAGLSQQDVNGSYIRLNRKGDELSVLNGVALPYQQLNYFDVLAGNSKRTRELVAMASPLLRMPIEYTQGQDTYSGERFGRNKNNMVGMLIEKLNAPKGVKDWLGYTKSYDDMGRPIYEFDESKTYFLFDAWATSRILRTSDRVWKGVVDGSDPNLLQHFLTATTNKKLDLNLEEDRRLKQRTKDIQKELIRRGVLKEVNIPPIPAEIEGY